jgi:hypothetical protein
MVSVPPAAVTDGVRGVTENRHSAGSCPTDTFESFTSIVVCLGAGSRFAATR